MTQRRARFSFPQSAPVEWKIKLNFRRELITSIERYNFTEDLRKEEEGVKELIDEIMNDEILNADINDNIIEDDLENWEVNCVCHM